MKNYYCSFGDYMVKFYGDNNSIDLKYRDKILVKEMCFHTGERKCEYAEVINDICVDYNKMSLYGFCGGTVLEIELQVSDNGLKILTKNSVLLKAVTNFDVNCYAMSTIEHNYIRCAYGPACTEYDNMIFDVQNDFGIIINGDCGKRFKFNYENGVYEINACISEYTEIKAEEDVYKNKYKIDYAPINKDVTFKKPPVGWMTWYAVMFDASEKTVLENTKWMAENLKKYGAETIWVDWEWYHKDKTGIRDDGCDTFNPDKEKYPNGLKFLSDEIRKYGLIPSLWIGYTNDSCENEFIKKHPDAVLVQEPSWCGQYFFDMSHPAYLEEFLPKALKQVDEWGYDAVKYDTLPICISMHEKYHSYMHNPEISTKEAYRNMIKKTREILGKDRYLLSCCGLFDSDVLWGCDMFDAARVGNDIFGWEEFVREGVGRTARYYPLHNIVFYNDPDNVVIREEYNNFEQAKSRTAFVGMLGLPVTLGDNLPELAEDRVELIRRTIPVLDIHPMDVCRISPDDIVITNLAVENRFDNYNVISVLNTTERETEAEICIENIGITSINPIIFEFYSSTVFGVNEGNIKFKLKPYETKIFAIREDKKIPQIISTSRHIIQGALEIEKISWNDSENTLSFTSELVENDEYIVTLKVSENYKLFEHKDMELVMSEGNIIRLSTISSVNESKEFVLKFQNK